MTLKETNWFNLFGKYTPEGTTWHALTTAYSLELEVIRSYKFMRKFSTNIDKSIIYHQNTYYLSDGKTKEQTWELEQQKCNQIDGVVHPEAKNMRTISFGNETSIWVSKQFSPNKNFGLETFFQQNDMRYSVIPFYEEGKLARIVMIKENSKEFPVQVEEDKIQNSLEKWSIKQTKLKPNLQMSTQEFLHQNLNFHSSFEANQDYFLPEKFYLNLPKAIRENTEFNITVGKQINPNLYKQIKILYNATGQLIELISEVYYLEV